MPRARELARNTYQDHTMNMAESPLYSRRRRTNVVGLTLSMTHPMISGELASAPDIVGVFLQ